MKTDNMKKFASVSIVLLLFLLVAPTVFAHPNDGRNRVIVHSSSFDRSLFSSKGCEITHELPNNAVSLSCPENVTVPNSEQDMILHVLDLSSDAQIKADKVWSSYTGNGVTIAVLDTGIDYNNLQLSSSSGSVDYVNGHCFAVAAGDCGNGFFDDFGHGAHVSGIITSDGIADASNGAFSKGVAPGTNVWMAKVCDAGGSCYTSDIVAAIQYIVNNRIAKVMSISLGGGGTKNANCDGDYLASQINWAYNNGVVSVVAAGNSGNSTVSSPACASSAIAVAAVDSSDNLAYFSSFGAALQDHGIAAPGVNIYSTVPTGSCTLCSSIGYSYLSGTSMATPHASATVALMLQKNPNLTPANIRSIIFNSADCLNNKYGTCSNTYIGYGRIDAYNAVSSTPSASATPFLSLLANPPSITTSQSSTITASVSDANSGAVISFSTDMGTLSTGTCTSDSTGKCSITFNSSTPGTATITATATGYTLASTTITVTSPPASLSVTVTTNKTSYTRNSVARITTAISANSTPISGTLVVLTITNPNGGTATGTGTTNSQGQVVFSYGINRNAPLGTYTATAQASKTSYNPGTGTTTFTVKK